jgi:hypothetical protein
VTRPLASALGMLAAIAVFALAEALHHSGHNPFDTTPATIPQGDAP